MMKVYNDNIKPEFTSFGKVAVGDTFAFEGANGFSVYIKIAHAHNNEFNNQSLGFTSLGFTKNCICLSDGKITGFSAEEPVRLIDCELPWKFRDTRESEE